MKPLIIDSSVIIKWLNKTKEEYLEQADKLLSQAKIGEVELFAPELAKYEIGNVLITKKVSSDDAKTLLAILYSFPINFVAETENLAKETFALAEYLGITYYDASFLSLATQYNATLVTDNIKHQGKNSGIKVISLKDYQNFKPLEACLFSSFIFFSFFGINYSLANNHILLCV